MAFEVPVPADFKADQSLRAPVGQYHAVMFDCDEEGGDKGEMVCSFEILHGTDTEGLGLKIDEKFPKQANLFWKIHRLALALKMVTSDQIKEHKAKGTSPHYDFPAKIGTHVHIDIQPQENNPKYQNLAFYAIDDKYCASWPKNLKWLEKDGVSVPAAPVKGVAGGASPGGAVKAPAAKVDVPMGGLV